MSRPKRIPTCHPDRRHRAHGLCSNCYQRFWVKNNPGKSYYYERRKFIKRDYGLDWAQYIALLENQNNVCAICQCVPAVFHIDHDHKTKQVRGLLCHKCNIGLHYIEQSEYREKALKYLKI